MLEDLVQTIETLQTRIKDYEKEVGGYESRTRVTLIDPMLSTLGWDVADPKVVEIEPKVEGGWADYALLGGNRKPVFFVEAKKLADKDPHAGQTIGYVIREALDGNSNVRYCAWTNGDAWEVYDTTAKSRVMSVSIAKEDAAKCAFKFLSLWRRSLVDGAFTSPSEPLGVNVTPVEPPKPEQLVPGCRVLVKQSAHASTFRGREGRFLKFGQNGGALVQVDNVKKWMSPNSLKVLTS